jgi:hypothetical protein
MVNPPAQRLLGFRAVNDYTFSWPVVLAAAAVVLVVGILVAWGVRALERRDRAELGAEAIQQAVGEAIARDPSLAGAAVLPVADIPVDGEPTLELTGRVPSAHARERAVRVVTREVRRMRPGMRVLDHLEVVAAPAERRPA